jgi:predicted enzyme related to lactoylglutathione lyase
MTTVSCIGAVLYAKNVAALRRFYQALLIVRDESVHVAVDHVAINSDNFQLVLVEAPSAIAASIVIENPPRVREETPIKLAFEVASIDQARVIVSQAGGEIWPKEREWNFGLFRVCDGRDPEGNVIQFRQIGRA